MATQPLYQAHGVSPAYQLRYTWTGWASRGELPNAEVLESVRPFWDQDGMRLLEHRWSGGQVQLAFSARPDVSPVLLAGRAKGRLQYAIRKAGSDFPGFSRIVAVRSVGENCRKEVEEYILGQVAKERFADPRFESLMEEFTVCRPEVDLSQPSESVRGRYWYNLHMVLVAAERYQIADRQRLGAIRDGCFRIARKKGHAISVLSVMPDHLHVALRGDYRQSPQQIALSFQNNLAYLLGQVRIWEEGFYVGTFSEYDMGAVRLRATPS
jgi:REP element-mobilizing transposase RayT